MQQKSDAQLLLEYADDGAEAAFAEIVARHTNLVYSATLRQVESPDIAAEIAQNVFVGLARTARTVSRRMFENASLAGWLCRSARNLSLNHRRDEFRRHSRERQAMETLDPNPDTPPDWEQLRPFLDDAMSELSEPDYDALVLRYFKNENLRSIGQAFGISDDAAQKRVSRAVDRLRAYFTRRGVTVGAAGLTALISANAIQAAPAGLATIIVGASLVGVAAAGSATLTLVEFIAMTKIKTGIIGALVVAGVATPLVIKHQADARLRARDAVLQQQSEQLAQITAENARLSTLLAQAEASAAPILPSPPPQVITSPARPAEDTTRELIDRILSGETTLKLTPEQAEAFLDENHRNAASLLAAYRTSGNAALLEEAMQRFPDDPQVAFEASLKKDASPQERRHWLDAFKESAPDNPLPNYLSALEHFKSGSVGQAVADLNAAAGKPKFDDYTVDRWQADEEAFRSAGYGEAETSMAATGGLLLPQLSSLKDVGRNMVDLANSYWQAGDVESAQTALQMAIDMGRHFNGSKGTGGVPLITQLVGIAVERMALEAMEPASPYGSQGQTVQDHLDQLAQRNDSIKEAVGRLEHLQPLMTPQDWITYNSRIRVFGEKNAIEWLINKYGEQ